MKALDIFHGILDKEHKPITLRLLRLPVVRCGEGRHDDVSPVDVDDVRHGLQDVEVEVRVSGDGAVHAGF